MPLSKLRNSFKTEWRGRSLEMCLLALRAFLQSSVLPAVFLALNFHPRLPMSVAQQQHNMAAGQHTIYHSLSHSFQIYHVLCSYCHAHSNDKS